MQATLNGPGLIKSTFGVLQLGTIGASSVVPIQLNEGAILVAGSLGLGSSTNTVAVAPQNAVLSFLPAGNSTSAAINLSNSTGVLLRGAITRSSFLATVTLSSPINLGPLGSIVGAQTSDSGPLELDGPISGGGLTANGKLILTGSSNTYTGATVITLMPYIATTAALITSHYVGNGSGTDEGSVLYNGGRLSATSSITIDRGTDITVDETGTSASPTRWRTIFRFN